MDFETNKNKKKKTAKLSKHYTIQYTIVYIWS
jgi:hypothetical protein